MKKNPRMSIGLDPVGRVMRHSSELARDDNQRSPRLWSDDIKVGNQSKVDAEINRKTEC